VNTRALEPSHASALRVGLDGRAFSSPAGGVRRYVNELAASLLALDVPPQLVALGAAGEVPVPEGVVRVPARSALPTNLGWSLDGLPRAYRRSRLDLFHAPAYTAPLRGVHPLVVTIHDVSYARHPEWYPYRRDPARRAFYRRSALAADIVVTDSEFSRQEICSAYGIPAERIRVIPLGVGASFTPPGAGPGKGDRQTQTILHVGDLHPRRNIGVLVEALALIRGESSLRDVELVLVGGDDGTAGTVTARADALGLSRVVRRVPRCSDETLVDLMRQAAVLAYPSLYEGFGLPALEAMACGLPVVASRAASIPEVVGEAGLLVDPLDVRAWRDALSAVLTSPARAASMRLAGVTRAATFTWRRTAISTLEVYRGVAAR
jgi:alpha-1,3-rhamnosyl/mannosyltransferase